MAKKRDWSIWLILYCFVLMFLTACSGKKIEDAVVYVNGDGISKEELALLDNDVEQAVRMKILQQWASKEGVGEVFSYEELMKRLEEENTDRKDKLDKGEVIYGVREYSPLQYYRLVMGEYERRLKEVIKEKAEEEELTAYYEAHPENYSQVGCVTAKLEIYWEDKIIREESITLDRTNYRTLSEGEEELVMNLEGMEAGEERRWYDEHGREWRLICESREEDYVEPFTSVQGAVGEQYSETVLEQEIAQRILNSKIQDCR